MREMKDSGIEWIGKIPKTWHVKPIRTCFCEVTNKNNLGEIKNPLKFTYGEIVPKSNFDADEDEYVANTILNYTIVEPGTIMLNGLNLNYDFVSQRIGLVKEMGIITSAYMAFKPISDNIIDSKFAMYLFKAYDNCKAFHNMGGGVRKILNFNEFKRYYFPFPDIIQQQTIANYLDRKCSEIDGLISDIEQQITVLEEYKKSVITEAVTKGLNPDVEMKDSGIEWIGKVPQDWNVIKVKYSYLLRGRIGWQGLRSSEFVDDNNEPYLITGTDFCHGYINWDTCTHVSMERFSQDIGLHIKEDDLLITKDGTIGKVAIAINCPQNVSLNSGVFIVRNNIRYQMFSKYFYYIILSGQFSLWFQLSNAGNSTILHLTQENFYNFSFTYPRYENQIQVANYLDKKCSEIDSIISNKKSQLDILKEYKKSLIYEYVTGKKEVPSHE